MKCHDIQNLLLLNEKNNIDLKNHLADCKDCQNFLQIVEIMHGTPKQFSPSAELDKKIIDFAKHQQKNRPVTFTFYLYTVAAALVILGLFLITKNSLSQQPEKITNIETPTITTPVVSNITTAPDPLDKVLDSLWEDEKLNLDMTIIEGELLVLSYEN